MATIFKVSYTYTADPAEWAKAYTEERARSFLDVPGLVWKLWLDEPEQRQSGGLFLFATRADAEAYAASPRGQKAKSNPALSDVRMEIFDVRDEMSRITHGPIPPAVAPINGAA
ncbi:YdhR family protein [Aquabacter sp. CN5-332]|uniref:YdhR family protein n=1 Tax=Aquabacter sp. CN5-332 TaxID=3156608 RepID=UPI0032B50B7F